MKESAKVFITKYALTRGIIEKVCYIEDEGFLGEKLRVRRSYIKDLSSGMFFYERRDFFLTEEEALVDFENRRKKKLNLLIKEIDKLEKLKIKIEKLEAKLIQK